MCFTLIGPLDDGNKKKKKMNCHVLITSNRNDKGRDTKYHFLKVSVFRNCRGHGFCNIASPPTWVI